MQPHWLAWAREIQALAQTGLAFNHSEFDVQRYTRLLEIAAEIVVQHTGLDKDATLANFRVQPGYATPKVDVRAAVIRDGKILLVQEKADNCWSMPGGWADVGDAPAEMVAREVWEESGFRVRVDRLTAVYDVNRLQPLEFYHAYKLVFLCTITGGAACPSNETLAVDFFDLEHLPPLSESRTSQPMLEEAYAQFADPSRPSVFD